MCSYIAINYVFLKKLVSFIAKRQTVSALVIFSCHCCVLYERLWCGKRLSSDVQANRYSRAGTRKKGSVVKKTCPPWTVKRSFFKSFFTFYVFLSGFFKEFNINLLKSTTSKLERLKGLPLLGFWLQLKRRHNSTSFFFLATIDKVNVSGFYSTYFKEAKNHFE